MSTYRREKKVRKTRSFKQQSQSMRDLREAQPNLTDYLLRKRQSTDNVDKINIPSIPEESACLESHLDDSILSIRRQLDELKQQNKAIFKLFSTLDHDIELTKYVRETQGYNTVTTPHTVLEEVTLSDLAQQTPLAREQQANKASSLTTSSCSSLCSSNSSSESFSEFFDETINSPIDTTHSPILGAKLDSYATYEKKFRKEHTELFESISMPTKYNTISRVQHSHRHQRSNSSEEDQPSRPSSAASFIPPETNKRRTPASFRRTGSVRCGFSSEVVSKIANHTDKNQVTCL